MVRYLSQEWLDLQQALTRDLPERPGATARVQVVIAGAPDGEVRYHQAVLDGRIDALALGDDPEANLTFTQAYDDAVQIARGELDVNAAFMQGRVKVTGSTDKVMALMPLTQSDEYQAALAQLSTQTEY